MKTMDKFMEPVEKSMNSPSKRFSPQNAANERF